MAGNVPVMVAFGHPPLHTFSLKEVLSEDTLETILEDYGPDTWGQNSNTAAVKVSSSRDGGYDKFNLRNTVNLVMKILKSDVIWIRFEKPTPVSSVPIKNAFDVLKNASNFKTLPKKIQNPVHEKAVLFNDLIDYLEENQVLFPLSACAPRVKNKKTGMATQLVHDLTGLLWKIGQCEPQLRDRCLWNKIPDQIRSIVRRGKKHEGVQMTQLSTKAFATDLREITNLAMMARPELLSFKVSLLSTADCFDEYSDFLREHADSTEKKRQKARQISSASEAVCVQIAKREKFAVIQQGSKPVTHPTITRMFDKMREAGLYKPVNIAVILPTNKNLRSYLLHKALPSQAPERMGLWSFDNNPAPQSLFGFLVDPGDTSEEILEKVQQLKPDLQNLQKFFYPREFYHQFNEQLGLVTGISPQMLRLVSSMIMGDNRKQDGEVQQRFEEAVMSEDPDFIFDMRHFNGSEVKFKDFLEEFRSTVQDYMVEDRGRHEQQYDGTVISKVSFGFSMKQIFKQICQKMEEKYPGCQMPQSEAFLYRYLIPRTRAASYAACRSEALIPLKLSMQQKVIEKPNVDAHFNAAQYKYLKNYAVELGDEVVCMIGWDDKTGVDVGEPQQPTAAIQHGGKSWAHSDVTVGEGQHSFHKTNLCPSVRLIHDIPPSMDGSFYRGLPQVCIKDAIFQHSTSARHATELAQMFLSKPELVKPVLIITNDGGVDHTIRHERNVISMLALFLHFPQVLLLINYQMAAYRSAYHPVEKANCILNLAWNGVSCSRTPFSDPVLEKAFSSCSSMSDVRKMAVKHPGLKDALSESLEEAVEVLEKRAEQASLKDNNFEVFKPATEEEVKDFLSIIVEVDAEFDIINYLDKTKTYHFSSKIKEFMDKHLVFTHYSVTFKRYQKMPLAFLNREFPGTVWNAPLEAVPCPMVDKSDPEKYINYEEVKAVIEKDYDDKCRPGKFVKTPSNIPFVKNKQRALYGVKIDITCFICRKRRAAYIQHKPSQSQIQGIKRALSDVKYICGGRISSFGRSLAVLEEVTDIRNSSEVQSDHEVSESATSEDDEMTGNSPQSESDEELDLNSAEDDSDTFSSGISAGAGCKSTRRTRITDTPSKPSTSWDISPPHSVRSDSTVSKPKSSKLRKIVSNNSPSSFLQDEIELDEFVKTCSFCNKIETQHQCKICRKLCCNFCNKMEVDELTDILCPYCETDLSNKRVTKDNNVTAEPETKRRGRPRNPVASGCILIPLEKKGRGRPRSNKPEEIVMEKAKKPRGRPKKLIESEDADQPSQTMSDEILANSALSELRMIGNENLLTKVFVDEALTCDSNIEIHVYDLLLFLGKPLPCFYCGDVDEGNLVAKLTDESFPLCSFCQKRGRGVGSRRKSRKIKPQILKMKKPVKRLQKKAKRKLID